MTTFCFLILIFAAWESTSRPGHQCIVRGILVVTRGHIGWDALAGEDGVQQFQVPPGICSRSIVSGMQRCVQQSEWWSWWWHWSQRSALALVHIVIIKLYAAVQAQGLAWEDTCKGMQIYTSYMRSINNSLVRLFLKKNFRTVQT